MTTHTHKPSTYLTSTGKTIRTMTKSAALAILRQGGQIKCFDTGLHQETEFHVIFPQGSSYKAHSEYSNECNSDMVLPDGTLIGGERHLFVRIGTWEETIKDIRGFDEVDPNRCLKMNRWESRKTFEAILAEV